MVIVWADRGIVTEKNRILSQIPAGRQLAKQIWRDCLIQQKMVVELIKQKIGNSRWPHGSAGINLAENQAQQADQEGV